MSHSYKIFIMKHKYILFFSLLILVAGSSCNRYYYKPNGVNAPLFTDGGQAHLNVAGSIGGNSGDYEGTRYVFDLQGSVRQ